MSTIRSRHIRESKRSDGVEESYLTQVKALDYLKDHKVQGVILVPGTQFILAALNTADLKTNCILQDILFHNMLFLDRDNNTEVLCTKTKKEGSYFRLEYKDINGEVTYSTMNLTNEYVEINSDTQSPDVEKVKKSAFTKVYGNTFYQILKARGNEYGAIFQRVEKIWREPGQLLAKLQPLPPELKDGQQLDSGTVMHPVAMDAAMHALLSAADDDSGTAVLSSCKEIVSFDNQGEPAWSFIDNIRLDNPGEVVGDIYILDEQQKALAHLKEVCFRFIDYNEKSPKKRQKLNINLAANFTADMIEKPLQFWADLAGYDSQINMAPYNQVFQQLLDPHSQLNEKNGDLNVLMINLEDWGNHSNKDTLHSDSEYQRAKTDSRDLYTLPNHLQIAHINIYETAYLYDEIFTDKCYLKHGISINKGDVIIDVGANIGMFSLFANSQADDITIYAFEPAPHAYDALKKNASLHSAGNIIASNIGISDQSGKADFTFYENSSVFSSFKADEEEDTEAVRTIIKNMLGEAAGGAEMDLDEISEELMADRMTSQTFSCQMASLSDIISKNEIESIDLLKIDAEKSEWDILRGISDQDWAKIKQIVIEVHDKDGEIIRNVMSLLDNKGFNTSLEQEQRLEESGLYTVFALRADVDQNQNTTESDEISAEYKAVKENAENLVDILKSNMLEDSTPYVVLLCPPSPNTDIPLETIIETEQFIAEELADFTNLSVVPHREVFKYYPVENYFDESSNRLGHIPYTKTFFGVAGAVITRKFHAFANSPWKVVVLDCDNTLWKGVCGEDGPEGIELNEPRRKFQEAIKNLKDKGFLLCLNSKNSESDVFRVFESRADMVLEKEDFVAAKINWQPKYQNIREIARELNLGLDSFIFIDDNPIECAEMRTGCPEVLTMQLPEKEDEIEPFLKNIWAFDRLGVTAEDRKRTNRYKENLERQQFQQSVPSLRQYLDGLNLAINVEQPTADDIPRLSQLTLRTNQFNFTTLRRHQKEVERMLEKGECECLICEVSDRFGDYGQVGAIFYYEKAKTDTLAVDTFILSCRVLGRGVEHYLLSKLGHIAESRNLETVQVDYLRTPKNEPAFAFMQQVASEFGQMIEEGHYRYMIPAERAKNVTYTPGESKSEQISEEKGKSPNGIGNTRPEKGAVFRDRRYLEKIAREYHSVDKIQQAIKAQNNIRQRDIEHPYVPPQNETQKKLAEIWQQVLGIDRAGLNDTFSVLGGSSLQAVQLISMIRNIFQCDIPVVSLYEHPTIGSMSEMLIFRQEQEKSSTDAPPQEMEKGKLKNARDRARGKKVIWRKRGRNSR